MNAIFWIGVHKCSGGSGWDINVRILFLGAPSYFPALRELLQNKQSRGSSTRKNDTSFGITGF